MPMHRVGGKPTPLSQMISAAWKAAHPRTHVTRKPKVSWSTDKDFAARFEKKWGVKFIKSFSKRANRGRKVTLPKVNLP